MLGNMQNGVLNGIFLSDEQAMITDWLSRIVHFDKNYLFTLPKVIKYQHKT